MTDDVLKKLMSEYLGMRAELLRFLVARIGDLAGAEDIYQELFVRLRSGQLPGEIGNIRAFLYRSAYNLANEHARAVKRRGGRDAKWIGITTHTIGADTVSDVAPADDALDAKQRLALVTRALERLSPKCREVFTLCRVQGLSHRDIAQRLGISTKTVEKHMTTALKHLVEMLRIDGGEMP